MERIASCDAGNGVLRGEVACMIFATDFRRQARVCARLAEHCEDRHLADRLRAMASNLAAKADDIEELPSERLRRTSF